MGCSILLGHSLSPPYNYSEFREKNALPPITNTEFSLSFPVSRNLVLLQKINLYVTNEFFHPYHLDESTFILRGTRSDYSFLFHFSMKFM